jgi:hypothetical protein
MNKQEFAAAIRTEVRDSAVEVTLARLEKPAGRRPSPDLVSLAEWYGGLSDLNRARVAEVAAQAAHAAAFGFLVVLDGARAIESTIEKGALELWYKKGDQSILLNGDDGPMLHDLL